MLSRLFLVRTILFSFFIYFCGFTFSGIPATIR